MLEIENLRVKVGEREILRGINLSIGAGEVHAIMGPTPPLWWLRLRIPATPIAPPGPNNKSARLNHSIGHPLLAVTTFSTDGSLVSMSASFRKVSI
jgi:hypothetical protein